MKQANTANKESWPPYITMLLTAHWAYVAYPNALSSAISINMTIMENGAVARWINEQLSIRMDIFQRMVV